MQLATTLAIVTGGVSGLGLAVAQHLVKHGGKVALFDVNDDKGAAAVASLGEDKARYIRTDVTDEDGVTASVDTFYEGQERNDSAHPQPEQDATDSHDAKDVVRFLDFLLEYLYDLPQQIKQYRERAEEK